MRDFLIMVTIFAVICWLSVLFFGAITGIQKSFSTTPTVDKVNIKRIDEETKRRARETRDRQKRLMQDYKQKVRDHQR